MIAQRILLTLIGIFTCVPGESAETTSPIDALLASSVEAGRIPGVIAIAATADEIIYEGAAGFRDIESNTAMTVDTITQIASMTKAITSVAVMQLVEQGKVKLGSPVGDYLPQMKEAEVLEGFDADNNPILRPAKTAVTVHQLLTHTSGFVYEIWNENAARYASSGHAEGGNFLEVPLAFDP